MTREETLKGLRCCSEFECGECPYKIYDDKTYTLRCMHRLMVDLQALELKTGTWIKAECSEKNGDATCSLCGHWDWSDCNYCSNCGAKMKEEN
jgi:hypothetical protein